MVGVIGACSGEQKAWRAGQRLGRLAGVWVSSTMQKMSYTEELGTESWSQGFSSVRNEVSAACPWDDMQQG